MCGIISVSSLDGSPVNRLVLKQYDKQKHRGQEGFGLYDYQERNMVRSPGFNRMSKWLKRYPSTNILFHHRMPTSTENVTNACHPFSTKDYFRTNYVLVHNGHITNDLELKREHEKLGIVYTSVQPNGSFNDSEALAWDVALYLEGKQSAIKAEGAIAFVCMAIGKGNKHDRLFFGRNSNPLNMRLNDKMLMLSSEGKGNMIDADKLYSYDYVNGKLTIKDCKIPRWGTWAGAVNAAKTRTRGWYANDYDDDELELVTRSQTAQHLIKMVKFDEEARERDFDAVRERYMWQNEGYFQDASMELMNDYDAITDIYGELIAANDDTADIQYTMRLYEAVSDNLDYDPMSVDAYSQDKNYEWATGDREYAS